MTVPEQEQPRTPSAWGLCPECGAVAPARQLHQQWHADLEARLPASQPDESEGTAV